jgi:hypothetical protein
MIFDDAKQNEIEKKANEEKEGFIKRFPIDREKFEELLGEIKNKPDSISMIQSFKFSNTSDGKLVDLLLQLQNQHEDKIKHYDNLRQANIKFAFTVFGALFTLAAYFFNKQSYLSIPIPILLLIFTILMSKIDKYFHKITHRATTIKNYLIWKIASIIKGDANTETHIISLLGFYDFGNQNISINKKSSLSINYLVLLWGSIVAFIYFLIITIIKYWKPICTFLNK